MWSGRVGKERVLDRLAICEESHGGGGDIGSSMMVGINGAGKGAVTSLGRLLVGIDAWSRK